MTNENKPRPSPAPVKSVGEDDVFKGLLWEYGSSASAWRSEAIVMGHESRLIAHIDSLLTARTTYKLCNGDCIAAPVAADQPAHDVSVRDQALEDVAKIIDGKAENVAQWGALDPDTGAFEFKNVHAEDAYNSYMELAEEVRALRSQPAKGDSNE